MKIRKVGVIGAGSMGSGIVQKIAQEGITAVMVDVKEEFVQKGMENIKKTLSKAVERGIFTQEQAKEILGRIKGTTEIKDVKGADLIIEAVFEDMNVKKKPFQGFR